MMPGEQESIIISGHQFLGRGDIQSAQTQFERALTRSPHPAALHGLAITLAYQGQVEQALSRLIQSIETNRAYRASLETACQLLQFVPFGDHIPTIFGKLRSLCQGDTSANRALDRAALQIEDNRNLSAEEKSRTLVHTLHWIGNKYGTDKSATLDVHTWAGMSYMDVYENYFAKMREQPISLLEIGVLEGNSLRSFEEYFPKAKIYGLDIDPRCKQQQGGRREIWIGSQADPEILTRLVAQSGGFDIVIDDGSHDAAHMLVSFEHLFPAVRPGGLYIIEDLGATYRPCDMNWPGMHYNKESELGGHREDFERFFLEHIRSIDEERGDILAVHFWHVKMVILKQRKPRW